MIGASLARGLDECGEPAVLISTTDHLPVFAAELDRRGWDVVGLKAEGLLTCHDAQQVLDVFMDGARLSPERFAEAVGGVIDDIAERFPRKTVRAFGEMVDLLWREGNEESAITLEELWNQLAESRRFALLCGYHLDIFDLDTQVSGLPEIIRVHTHQRPAADTFRLATAVDRALTEVFGPLEAGAIYLQVAEKVPLTHLPRAQAVLTWLSQRHPATAQQVLDSVRTHYSANPVLAR